ncbi:uncharacterized protein [Eurosta solidaginis]|uniref:uncharacterized protein n=1 Tax=Eurosta solidaginis TaxID=178769 RepID=UPI0035316581
MEKKQYKKRNQWREGTEAVLIDIWRSKVGELRGVRKNSHIVEQMAVELEQLGVVYTPAEIKSKMHNLTSKYRKEKAQIGPSGGAPSSWPLYAEIHQLLAPFKSYNPEGLVEDSIYENVETLDFTLESPETSTYESAVPSKDCESPTPSTSTATRSAKKKIIN